MCTELTQYNQVELDGVKCDTIHVRLLEQRVVHFFFHAYFVKNIPFQIPAIHCI